MTGVHWLRPSGVCRSHTKEHSRLNYFYPSCAPPTRPSRDDFHLLFGAMTSLVECGYRGPRPRQRAGVAFDLREGLIPESNQCTSHVRRASGNGIYVLSVTVPQEWDTNRCMIPQASALSPSASTITQHYSLLFTSLLQHTYHDLVSLVYSLNKYI